MPFLLKLYFEKVPSHISYLCWFMNMSLMSGIKHDVCHFFGILRGLFHFFMGMGVSTLLGLELVLINYRNVSFFSVSLVILTLPLTPAILKSSLLILLSLWLSLNFCPERICWGKTERPLLTEFSLNFSWLLIRTVKMNTNHSFHLYNETYQVINIKL